MGDNFDELDGKVEKRNRAIIDIKEEWVWYQRWAAAFINSIPVFLWVIVTYFLITLFNANSELIGFRNAYLNIIVPAAAYGVMTLVAGLSLISWLFPYFNYRRIMREGSSIEKASCMLFWGLVALAISIIVAGAM